MRFRGIILLFLIGWLCILPVSASAQSSGPIYIVQPGDTLSYIAQLFGTTVEALAIQNNIADPQLIVPGMELVIPGYEGISGILQFRQISFGEDLSTLSLRHGIPKETLIRLNRIVQPDRLYVGQTIIYLQPESEKSNNGARFILADEDDTGLSFALRNGINPWSLSNGDGDLDRSWILPGESLLLTAEQDGVYGFVDPLEAVSLKPSSGTQGHTMVINVTLSSDVSLKGQLGEWPLNFHPYGERALVALQGIHALEMPGVIDLRISLLRRSDEQEFFSFSQPVRIMSGDYGYDPVLQVPPETIDPEKTGPEDDLIASIISQITDDRYWEGKFLFPSTITESFPSVFGSRRNYNGVGYLWYHTGLDFYGGAGTPITAPARGKVVFVGPLDVRGNVTFIDHGWGVFTGYLHQSQISVSVGDWVEAGQEIGLVGRTGRVTGPHLHWEVWVGGVPVDPIEWTSESFP
jgi:murein DD-endopeptidase MepM/ murein hydrolase activator NlpD